MYVYVLKYKHEDEQSSNIGFGIQRIPCSLLQFTVMLLGTSRWWFDFYLYFSCASYYLCYKICPLIVFLVLKLETRCSSSLCDVLFWNHTISCIWYSRSSTLSSIFNHMLVSIGSILGFFHYAFFIAFNMGLFTPLPP